MKFGIVILVVLVVCLSPSVNGAESDVVRIFNDKLRLTNKEMQDYLKQADLERYGFTKTVEVSTETDENGKTTTKKTIYYKVTDDCSRVMFWEGILEQRLPEELQASKLSSTIVKEVKSRIAGRKTKSCTVMLEIHPKRCLKKIPDNGVSKRTAHQCNWCLICFAASIRYGK
ncbi:Hypothetical predicted protein [Paramuricea clavata]|uniref:Uncharacterized protein n=1 Tax=Paramuricea clavata TaxID=317549 RepID=A0A7D9LWW8_PARCT|nr:Hypothetical predicted protein [Paramuricea clavata]